MSTTSESHVNPESSGSPDRAHLDRTLGVGSIVFMVVAGSAPLAVACAAIPIVFALSANKVAPLYYVGAAVILALFSVGFVLLSKSVKNAGAFYAYIQAGLGKAVGGGSASLAIVAYAMFNLASYCYFGVIAKAAADQYLNIDLKWWIWAFAAIVLVAFLAYRNIDLSAKVLGVLLVCEALIVLIVDFAIVFKGGSSGLSGAPLNPSEAFDGAPGLGLIFAFLGFFGFEATAVFRNEAKDPDRTIPRATYTAIGLIGVVYCFTAWAVATGFGVNDVVGITGADPGNAFQNLAVEYVGTAAKDVITILLVTSFLAGLLTFQNVVARYQFALANTGFLPRALGKVHPKHLSPAVASVTFSVVSFVVVLGFVLGGLDPLTQIYPWLSGMGAVGIIVLMVLCTISVLVFHQRTNDNSPIWNAVIAPVLALAGLGYTLYLVIKNLDLLVGSKTAATIVEIAAIAVFALGAAAVMYVKAKRPNEYAGLLEG